VQCDTCVSALLAFELPAWCAHVRRHAMDIAGGKAPTARIDLVFLAGYMRRRGYACVLVICAGVFLCMRAPFGGVRFVLCFLCVIHVCVFCMHEGERECARVDSCLARAGGNRMRRRMQGVSRQRSCICASLVFFLNNTECCVLLLGSPCRPFCVASNAIDGSSARGVLSGEQV
jgi:hypothetical protein